MENLVATMLVWASVLSGYPLPIDQPKVVLEPHSFFVSHQCKNIDTDDDPCEYVGLYVYSEKTIYIDQALDKNTFDAILVHELVHFLQHKNNHWADDSCASRIKREHEAYKIEERYFKEAEHVDRKAPPPSDEEICS